MSEAWAGQAAHCILDTSADWPNQLLATWTRWQADPQRCDRLHCVALATPQDAHETPPEAVAWPGWLKGLFHGLEPGVHRINIPTERNGELLLTLLVPRPGEGLQAQLRSLVCTADTVLADFRGEPPGLDLLKALVRHCQRGARIALPFCDAPTLKTMSEVGLQVSSDGRQAIYQPPWPLRRTESEPVVAGSAVVIGAGLSGAAVAHSLARRGWQVSVLDAAAQPALGASSLPVGLLAPHVSTDDAPLSRASRCGLRMSLQAAHALLREGIDFQPTPVLRADQPLAQAAWIKPGALVNAWLAHPGIRFLCGQTVERVQCVGDNWQALDAGRTVLAEAQLLVLCTAHAVTRLLPVDPPATSLGDFFDAVAGQVAIGPLPAELAQQLPANPVSGHGHFIPGVPGESGGDANRYWLSGSTYERAPLDQLDADQGLQANRMRLTSLLPAAAHALDAQFAAGQVQHWRGLRCTSRDRLPVVGQWLPGLHVSAAMGSRGLTFAALAAELLAARLHGEPLPVEAALDRAMDVRRLAKI